MAKKDRFKGFKSPAAAKASKTPATPGKQGTTTGAATHRPATAAERVSPSADRHLQQQTVSDPGRAAPKEIV